MDEMLYLHCNCSNLKNRIKLNRRRLEAAHLKYAVLVTATNYPDLFGLSDVEVYPDVREKLQHITPKYYSGFKSRYLGKETLIHT